MRIRKFVCALSVGTGLLTSAYAAPIDNPGNYTFSTGDATFSFKESAPFTSSPGTGTGSWEIDIDAAGDFTTNAMTIGALSVPPYSVQLQVNAGGTSGNIDASAGGYNSLLTLRFRIKVTNNGVGAACMTSYVNATVEGMYIYYPAISGPPPFPAQGVLTMYTGTTQSGSGTWVAVPGMTGSNCVGQEATINALLGLGAAGGLGAVKIDRLTAVKVGSPPQGS